jgi:taurine transport system substrate-binding protein
MISISSLARRAALLAGIVLFAGSAHAHTKVVIGHQLIVGPFLTAIADGSFDAAARQAGYVIEWRKFQSTGDITVALASGNVTMGVLGSTGIATAVTRGVDLQLFWILDNVGRSEALVARNGSGIHDIGGLKGKRVATPFVSTSHFHLLVGLDQVWKMPARDLRILNMTPPQIVAAWERGDIDAAYVWPPALTTIQKTGRTLADSEQVGKASVPTFDGLVVDKQWARNNPAFMAAFTRVLAQTYAGYHANAARWTMESPQVQGMVRLIGGTPADMTAALALLEFPRAHEQASATWLGGGGAGGAVRALEASARFLQSQKQIDAALDDYSGFVTDRYVQSVAREQEATQ